MIENSFDDAPCGLLKTTVDGLILDVNDTFCTWFKYEKKQLIQMVTIQSLFSMGGRLFHHTHLAPLLKMQSSVSEVHLELLSFTKEKIPVLMNAVTKHDGEKNYHYFAFFTSFDRSKYERELLIAKKNVEITLTEKIEAERVLKETERKLIDSNTQLSEASHRKDEFLAILAHELRNPLAPIRNVLEILKLRKLEDLKLEWSRKIIKGQVTQLTHLVDDLMDVSRITQGKIDLNLTEFDLSEAVKTAIESCKTIAKASSHNLVVSLPLKDLIVRADKTRMIQIISNILNNAIKYTPEGGTINISAEGPGNEVVVSIKDTGIGIDSRHLHSVFEMFSQVESAKMRSQGGLGIGLALVKGLVELHQGKIAGHSGGLGKGSEFVVTLPLLSSRHNLQNENNSTYSPGNGRRIVVIDDHIEITESMTEVLEMLGYKVASANLGMSGIELAEEFRPEIILLDIGLPDINGYEVAKLIRKRDWAKEIILIAASGWGQSQDKALAREAGFNEHLTKPVDFRQLDELLKVF